jgi:pectinesterase
MTLPTTHAAPWVLLCAAVVGGAWALAAAGGTASAPTDAQGWLAAPDVVVAADGSGDFTTIAAALASLDPAGKGRVVILIRDGVYREHLAIRRSCVTLRGQSRKGTIVEYPLAYGDWVKHPDDIGRGVVNVYGDDVVFENLTIRNTQPNRTHAFALFGRGDRTVTLDCDLLGVGNDTVSLWHQGGGRYYHARCHFTGAVDFLCPRGWCYVVDSSFYEVATSAAIWHDGENDPNKKFVLRHCTFDGAKDFPLGRYHRDHQFYLLDCTFSPRVARDVINNVPKGKEKLNWGHRVFYFNSHREGQDAPWCADNLDQAPGHPKPEQITAAWAFDSQWDPQRTDGPAAVKTARGKAGGRPALVVTFSEPVTVRGTPALVASDGSGRVPYLSGSGGEVLTFGPCPPRLSPRASLGWDFTGGVVFASQAGAALRPVQR